MQIQNNSAPQAAVPEEKFVKEFSVTKEVRDELKAYLDLHHAQLCAELHQYGGEKPVTAELNKLVGRLLPDASRPDLEAVLNNRADYVVLIHNFPEREGLEHDSELARTRQSVNQDADKSYSLFLGNALYANFGLEHAGSRVLTRQSHKKITDHRITGDHTHRDLLGTHIIFSAPYNGEQAYTQFIGMRRAIEALPEDKRKQVRVEIDQIGDSGVSVTLQEVLDYFTHDKTRTRFSGAHDKAVTSLEVVSKNSASEEFLGEVKKHTHPIEITPGTLAVFCEDGIFHCSQRGAEAEHIPQTQAHSRVFVHNAGIGIER